MVQLSNFDFLVSTRHLFPIKCVGYRGLVCNDFSLTWENIRISPIFPDKFQNCKWMKLSIEGPIKPKPRGCHGGPRLHKPYDEVLDETIYQYHFAWTSCHRIQSALFHVSDISRSNSINQPNKFMGLESLDHIGTVGLHSPIILRPIRRPPVILTTNTGNCADRSPFPLMNKIIKKKKNCEKYSLPLLVKIFQVLLQKSQYYYFLYSFDKLYVLISWL